MGHTPQFIATEPLPFARDSSANAPLASRTSAMYALIQSLDSAQLSKAGLARSFTDVAMGAGRDLPFPMREGVPVVALNGAQQALVRQAIDAWLREIPPLTGTLLRAEYTSPIAFAATSVAWSGATTPTSVGSYVRIDGPRLWIELLVRPGEVMPGALHVRTLWRDRSFDYIPASPWDYLRSSSNFGR